MLHATCQLHCMLVLTKSLPSTVDGFLYMGACLHSGCIMPTQGSAPSHMYPEPPVHWCQSGRHGEACSTGQYDLWDTRSFAMDISRGACRQAQADTKRRATSRLLAGARGHCCTGILCGALDSFLCAGQGTPFREQGREAFRVSSNTGTIL